MMSKVLMGAGSWSIKLSPDTPQSIRRMFPRPDSAGNDQWWSHVVFTEVDQLAFDSDDVTSLGSVFTGPVWSRAEKMTRFSGPHMTGWLSNQRGDACPYSSSGIEYPTGWLATPKTITQIVQAWFPALGEANGIRYGTAYSAPATTIEGRDIDSYLPLTKRPIDEMMAQVGCEYRVSNSGVLDWGAPASLFAGHTSPSFLCADDIRTSSGAVRALNATVRSEEDMNGYRNFANVETSDGLSSYGGPGFVSGAPVMYHLYSGGIARFGPGMITTDTPDSAGLADLHQAAVAEYAFPNRRITVLCDDYCVLADLEAGDAVYCWSPDDFIEDADIELDVAGRTINPEILRVTQIDQPFQEGMGVYVVQYTGSGYLIARITDYVERENQPTRLTLGSRPHPPATSRDQKAIIR